MLAINFVAESIKKKKYEKKILMITYDNHHKHEDFLLVVFFVYVDLQRKPMQLLIFHYGHKTLMQLFPLDLMLVLSNLNHIYDHVQ